MKSVWLYLLSLILVLFLSPIKSSPVKFDDIRNLERKGQEQPLSSREEGRVFHAHAIKKRKKKKLLHCLLSLQRSNPKPQGDARFLVFNYMNLEYNLQGGNNPYHDDNGNSNYNNCLNQLTGSDSGGGGGGSGLDGIGEGISNLGSLVGQVGQVPSNLISSVGDGIKPVFENPERYINRYIIRPLYRSLRPLYRWF